MLRFLEGQSVETIASYFELQTSTISAILNSPMVRQEMDQMTHTATERIANLTDEAVDLVRDTMRGEVGSELRFKAAKDLLDRNRELNPKGETAKEMMEGLGEGMIRAISKQLREMEKTPEHEIPSSDAQGTALDSGSGDR